MSQQPPSPPPPPPHHNINPDNSNTYKSRPPRYPMYVPTSPTSIDSPSPLNGPSMKGPNSPTPPPPSMEEFMNKDDQAERGLLQSMEDRRSTSLQSGGDAWQSSVVGERPPLGGAVPMDRLMMATTTPPIAVSTGNTNSSVKQHHRRRRSTSSQSVASSSKGSTRTGGSSQHSASKLADIARRMRQKTHQLQQQQASLAANASDASNATSVGMASDITAASTHRRAPSRAHAMLDIIQEQPDHESSDIFDRVGGGGGNGGGDTTVDQHEDTNTSTTELLNQTTTHADHLLVGAMQVEELFDDGTHSLIPPPIVVETIDEAAEGVEEEFPVGNQAQNVDENNQDYELMGETVPLTSTASFYSQYTTSLNGGPHDDKNNAPLEDDFTNLKRNNSTASSVQFSTGKISRSARILRAKQVRQRAQNIKKQSSFWTMPFVWVRRQKHPLTLFQDLVHFVWFQTYLLSMALPCAISSSVLFYGCGNPSWSFLPGHASIAWWFMFFGRQTVLYEGARLCQWFLIDKVVLGTRIAVQCLGPLLTLCFIQARGWPFCVSAWGFLDLLLLEGSSSLAQHWFWFSGLFMYNQMNSGSYILNSDTYERILFSMLVAGAATAVKRTAVAMYFGRRTFAEFKPRLEKLLKEVVLVSELAALAEEAEIAASEEQAEVINSNRAQNLNNNNKPTVKILGDVSWNNPHKKRDSVGIKTTAGPNRNDSDSEDDEEEDRDDDSENSEITTQHDILPENQGIGSHRETMASALEGMLEHWEEPINKGDKSFNASISDILRFRRALSFMDDDLMFGEAFGPASTREQVLLSAQSVYRRLLMLTPGRVKVSCEFYEMLALDDDNRVNRKKLKALRRLFRPDAKNTIPLLAFVQSCDALYKKLRYFRANVGNASVIDHALESIVDGAFSFVLALALLSVMRINPWPLLVSLSTLLVSISFAVGTSAAKWFEGMLLVAARRPYDLGDRIYMTDPNLVISDGLWYCWFVEDITLFHTTVRYAGTNEVATINNGSIANMRIINGARSQNSFVWFQFAFRPTLMDDGNMDKIKAALEQYARDNPRNWHSFGYFRVDEVHPDIEKLVVTVGMQHRSAWQDLVRILEAKAAIMCWLMEYCRKMGVLYDQLPQRELMYYAGNLKDGGVQKHRFELHNPNNIVQGGFNNLGPTHVPQGSFNSVIHTAQRREQYDKAKDAPLSPVDVSTAPIDSYFLQQLKQSHGSQQGSLQNMK